MLRGRLGDGALRCAKGALLALAVCASAGRALAQAPVSGFGPPPQVPPTASSVPPQAAPAGPGPVLAPAQPPPPPVAVPAPAMVPETVAPGAATPQPPAAGAAQRMPTAVPTPGELVVDVRVVGNDSIPMTKIRPHVRTMAERPFDADLIQEDVRALNRSRMFIDVQALYDRNPQGELVVIFKVSERPTLRYIRFVGNKKIKQKVLLRKSEIKVGDSLDPFAIEEARRRLEQFYHDKGYQKVQIELKEGTQPGDRGAVFEIVEGPPLKISSVEFVGNSIATDARLKAATHMESKPPILWIWKGYYDEAKIEADKDRITDYYRSLGFFRAAVSREIEFNDDGDWAKLTFVVDEGPRYRIRDVKFIGNEKLNTELLSSGLGIKTGEYFDRTKLNIDLSKIQDEYGGRGYIFADVQADPRFQEEPGVLDLVYVIEEGQIWRVGKINVHIGGENPHTRIAAALNRISLRPGDIVDIREVRASERRLRASNLFLSDPTQGEPPRITFTPPDEEQFERDIARKPKGATPPPAGNFRGQSPDPAPAEGVIDIDLFGTLANGAAPASAAPASPPRSVLPGPNQRRGAAALATQGASHAYGVQRPNFDTSVDEDNEHDEDEQGANYGVERFLDWMRELGPHQRPAAGPQEAVRSARFQSPYGGRTMPVAQAPAPVVGGAGTYYGPGTLPSQYAAPNTAPVPGERGTLPPRAGSAQVVQQPAPYAAPGASAPYVPPQAPNYGLPQAPAYAPPAAPPYAGAAPQAPAPAYQQNFNPPPAFAAPPTTPGGEVFTPGPPEMVPGYADPNQLYPDGGYDFLGQPREPTIDLDTYVTETQTGRLMFSVGVNSDAGLIGSAILDEQNFDITRVPRSFEEIRNGTAFRGAGQQFRIEAVPGTQVQRYSFNFREPYLFDTAVSFGVSAFLYDRRYDDWDEQRLGGRVSLGYMFSPDLSGTVYMRAENVDIRNIVTPAPPELLETAGDNDLFIGGVSLAHDTRDNTFMPTEGHYIELSLEQGFGTYDFPRANVEARQYFLVGQRADGSGRQTIGLSGRLGFSGNDTPVFEHYFAGGFTTLRGFDFRGASPRDMGAIVGGEFLALGSAEYIFPLTANDMLRGIAFCDFGTVEPDVRFDSDSFRVSPGLGLRIQIAALGPAPIALDFAVPVMHAEGDDIQNFSFFVGFGR